MTPKQDNFCMRDMKFMLPALKCFFEKIGGELEEAFHTAHTLSHDCTHITKKPCIIIYNISIKKHYLNLFHRHFENTKKQLSFCLTTALLKATHYLQQNKSIVTVLSAMSSPKNIHTLIDNRRNPKFLWFEAFSKTKTFRKMYQA